MDRLKVAIFGIGKIGEFHVREFNNFGCDVVAILTKSKESAKNNIKKIRDLYGINVRGYTNLDELLKNENLDAVSICTPSELHSEQTRKCLECGLNILCEKPFVCDSINNNYPTAKELLKIAKSKGKILTINTQWPSVFSKIKNYYGKEKIEKFSMSMEPFGIARKNLIIECLPHFNSMLLKLFNKIKPENINFFSGEDYIRINFNYLNNKEKCEIEYLFKQREIKPSKISFSINNHNFYREIRGNNKQYLIYNGKESFEIEDPLKVSIRSFINAIEKREKPLIGREEILQNVKLQDFIMKDYLSIL